MRSHYASREEKHQRKRDKVYQETPETFLTRLPRRFNTNTTSGIVLTTLFFASIIIAAAQEVEADLQNGSQLNTTTIKKDSESNAAKLAAEVCINGMCTKNPAPPKPAAEKPFVIHRSVSVDKKLLDILSEEQISQAKYRITQLLQKYSDSSESAKKHIEYSLATGFKFLINDSEATTWLNYYYNANNHILVIPLPPKNMQSIAKRYDIDEYEYRFRAAIQHELEHSRWAQINSDSDCQPIKVLTQKWNAGDRKFLAEHPSQPEELMQRISTVQNYILEHVAKILPQTYFDFTKTYPDHPRLFKMQPETTARKEHAKEIAHLQTILKDYQPRRNIVELTKSDVDNLMPSLKAGDSIVSKGKDGLDTYFDHFFTIDGRYFGMGYFVENPKDKLRAFVMDTKYVKERMPKTYQKAFAESRNPVGYYAAEMEAHTMEIGLDIYERIYTSAAEFTKQKQQESACQPQILNP